MGVRGHLQDQNALRLSKSPDVPTEEETGLAPGPKTDVLGKVIAVGPAGNPIPNRPTRSLFTVPFHPLKTGILYTKISSYLTELYKDQPVYVIYGHNRYSQQSNGTH